MCFFHSKVVLFGPTSTSCGWIKIRFFLTNLGLLPARKQRSLSGLPFYVPDIRGITIKETCSKWGVIEWVWEEKSRNYSFLMKKGNIPIKPALMTILQWVRKNLIFIHSQDVCPKGTNFEWKKNINNNHFSV